MQNFKQKHKNDTQLNQNQTHCKLSCKTLLIDNIFQCQIKQNQNNKQQIQKDIRIGKYIKNNQLQKQGPSELENKKSLSKKQSQSRTQNHHKSLIQNQQSSKQKYKIFSIPKPLKKLKNNMKTSYDSKRQNGMKAKSIDFYTKTFLMNSQHKIDLSQLISSKNSLLGLTNQHLIHYDKKQSPEAKQNTKKEYKSKQQTIKILNSDTLQKNFPHKMERLSITNQKYQNLMEERKKFIKSSQIDLKQQSMPQDDDLLQILENQGDQNKLLVYNSKIKSNRSKTIEIQKNSYKRTKFDQDSNRIYNHDKTSLLTLIKNDDSNTLSSYRYKNYDKVYQKFQKYCQQYNYKKYTHKSLKQQSFTTDKNNKIEQQYKSQRPQQIKYLKTHNQTSNKKVNTANSINFVPKKKLNQSNHGDKKLKQPQNTKILNISSNQQNNGNFNEKADDISGQKRQQIQQVKQKILIKSNSGNKVYNSNNTTTFNNNKNTHIFTDDNDCLKSDSNKRYANNNKYLQKNYKFHQQVKQVSDRKQENFNESGNKNYYKNQNVKFINITSYGNSVKRSLNLINNQNTSQPKRKQNFSWKGERIHQQSDKKFQLIRKQSKKNSKKLNNLSDRAKSPIKQNRNMQLLIKQNNKSKVNVFHNSILLNENPQKVQILKSLVKNASESPNKLKSQWQGLVNGIQIPRELGINKVKIGQKGKLYAVTEGVIQKCGSKEQALNRIRNQLLQKKDKVPIFSKRASRNARLDEVKPWEMNSKQNNQCFQLNQVQQNQKNNSKSFC